MPDINLDSMSLDELKQLRKDVDKAIESYEKRKRQEAVAAAEAAAQQHGFKLADITGGKAKGGAANPPKYAHPQNPSLTWSGRGRQPKWIKEGLAAGKSLDDFLIKG